MTIIYRKDYVAPHYQLTTTHLDFTLDPTHTIVRAKLDFERVDTSKPIVLNGEYMKLISVKMDGVDLPQSDYQLDDHALTLLKTKECFTLETEVGINPEANTRLMGLYMSNGMFCTQCEPEGFRSITYYPDHSDVPSKFFVTIRADRKKYPVLLSNGNCIKDEGNVVTFEDPFNKPCYLFALVAGNLDSLHDTFKTMSGKTVELNLYCEAGKKERLTYAMKSIKKAMKWDEEKFGLEYDLDRFSIVAVSHFNAGAMENKSLNIFNDSALLATPDTATDAAFKYIERVIAHEYFHNYSGDRVTLRDWFDLSLKEGFTVFRDSEFTYDMHSRPVERIDDAIMLRSYQFPEDDGPLAHPVRPDSFQSIDNFYTTTVYEKGAELIRMQKAIVGEEAFFKGCDIYFKRNDGKAVTIDDFVKAIEDGSDKDLTQFKQWYSVAGRPVVKVETSYNDDTFTVKLSQSHKTCPTPFVIPLHFGLVGFDGKDVRTGTFILDKPVQTWTFDGLTEKPVLSINRFFTAPVDIKINYTDAERLHLMKYDTDLFNRYDMGHQYALETMVQMIKNGTTVADEKIIQALGSYLDQDGLDKEFLAYAINLPSKNDLMQQFETADLDLIYTVRDNMAQKFADVYADKLYQIYRDNTSSKPYSLEADEIAKRVLKNAALGYLAKTKYKNLVFEQFESADNLTDRLSALNILSINELDEKDKALEQFFDRYKDDALVINKWFVAQTLPANDQTLDTVKKLTHHPLFDYKNPNKVRALIGAFTGNLKCFNDVSGTGYQFFAEECSKIDEFNPHLAARLLTAFSKVNKLSPAHKQAAVAVLKPLYNKQNISITSKETLERLLKTLEK